jgi:hypothetical protein
MACCLSGDDRVAKRNNDAIEKAIKADKAKSRREFKLLLLGMFSPTSCLTEVEFVALLVHKTGEG